MPKSYPPTAKGLPDDHVVAILDELFKTKAQLVALGDYESALKNHLIEINAFADGNRLSTDFGIAQFFPNGKKSDVYSALGAAKLSVLKEELRKTDDLRSVPGDAYMTASATQKAEIQVKFKVILREYLVEKEKKQTVRDVKHTLTKNS